MAEELQGLLNRIKEEGISEAESRRKELIAEAEAEAKTIVDAARQEADRMRKEAKKDAEQFHERGEEALRQASRDLLISVRDALKAELEATVNLEIQKVLSPETLADIIERMLAMFTELKGDVDGLETLLAEKDRDALEDLIVSRFTDRLKHGVTLTPSTHIEAGIKVGTRNDNMFIDFTDEALTEMICEYLNPRIAELVRESMEK